MNIVFLTQVTGFLSPFAWIMGVILNAIHKFLGLFGNPNIALCIILFTFVIKMLMLPLTIKQQKYTRLSSRISPELKKIQDKYKGKRDEESMRRQNAETQELYRKYGTSPIGGCLPLLITLPIMFALYRVIYAIPAYVTDIGSLYGNVVDKLREIPNFTEPLKEFMTANSLSITERSGCGVKVIELTGDISREYLIDLLAKFNPSNWESSSSVDAFAGLKAAMVTVKDSAVPIADVVDKIIKAHSLFGLNILDTPSFGNIPSLIIPVLAVVTQMLQTKISMANTKQATSGNDAMSGSLKGMNTIMPIMSGVFCLMLPIGVGVYWIASAVFTILQTIFINRYLDKTGLDEIIEKNIEKENKKKESLGVSYGNQMAGVAKTSTKTYSSDEEYDNTAYKKNNKRKYATGGDYKRSQVSYSASSIAANANLLARNSAPQIEKKEDNTPAAPAKTEEAETAQTTQDKEET